MSRLTPADMVRAVPEVNRPEAVESATPSRVDEYDVQREDIEERLNRLRMPFPPEMIEKLPKPLWKGAWDGERSGRCSECGGYHVLANAIHLDYVGHANATNRLLETDLFWSWEPMAYTPEGLPLFDRTGGLWIRLTICGMTRIGYGDGKSVKEVIGDAIRNAAMRFGVALDLWAKINLHEERNPGDGATRQESRPSPERRRVREVPDNTGSGNGSPPPRAANQDALDTLGSVCDEHGYDKRWAAERFKSDYDLDIRAAEPDDILIFAQTLVDEAESGAGLVAAPDEAGQGSPTDDGNSGGVDSPAVGDLPPDAGAGSDGPLF